VSPYVVAISSSRSCSAYARVQANRPGLDDEPPDQLRVDRARGHDLAAGGLFDLGDHLRGLLVGELDSGLELELEDALAPGEQARPLLVDLLDFADAVLLHEQADEVEEELLGALEQLLERGSLRPDLDLWVSEEAAQVVRVPHSRGELVELLADLIEALVLQRSLEQRFRVDALGDGHAPS
jgi:hypothetical protein